MLDGQTVEERTDRLTFGVQRPNAYSNTEINGVSECSLACCTCVLVCFIDTWTPACMWPNGDQRVADVKSLWHVWKFHGNIKMFFGMTYFCVVLLWISVRNFPFECNLTMVCSSANIKQSCITTTKSLTLIQVGFGWTGGGCSVVNFFVLWKLSLTERQRTEIFAIADGFLFMQVLSWNWKRKH
jgi:hypothetical protein